MESYAIWNSIRGAALSPNGLIVAYSVAPGLGDGELIVRNLQTGQQFRHSRGFIGRQQLTPGTLSNPEFPDAQFTADGLHILFAIEPTRDEFERLHVPSGAEASSENSDLGIMDVRTGGVVLLSSVERFQIPAGSGRWLAYAQASKDAAGTSRLSLRDLASDQVQPIAATSEFNIDDEGEVLAYSVRNANGDGAVFVRTIPTGEVTQVYQSPAAPGSLKLSSHGRTLAFYTVENAVAKEQNPHLIFVDVPTREAREIPWTEPATARLKLDVRAGIHFSVDNRVLVFRATAPLHPFALNESVATPAARLELWTWRDPIVEPASHAKGPSVTVTYDLATSHLRLLRSDSDRNSAIALAAHATVALISIAGPYEFERLWHGFYRDYDVVDLTTGTLRHVAKHVQPQGSISPGGRFVLYFDESSHWHTFELASGIDRDLTGRLDGIRFDQETWSYPAAVAPWGIAGWTTADGSVLIYDRYDVWEFDPLGDRPARCITAGAGRAARRVFRVSSLGNEEMTIDPLKPLLLRATDDDSKATGYWRAHAGQTQAPERLLHLDKRLGNPIRARNADVYLYSQETFEQSPDLWVAVADFKSPRRVSDINPQQPQYRWGTSELVHWRDASGAPLQGVLYKPERFDPQRKYPLLVFIYERMSQHLYAYKPPEPSAEINRTIYVSNDYLVFEPDIHYKIGAPGVSALECVESGVRSLIARGIVDTKAIGLQGISWGGYEAGFIISHSNLFSAAVLDSPITDIVSDYGEFAYDDWVPRLTGYEYLQNRIGASLWANQALYIANSPIMAADKITAPILIMANDGDGTVPWVQGLELYGALRRLEREVYLVDYRGDQHQPGALGNRIDIARRTKEFLDCYLRHVDPPRWMTSAP